MKSILKFKLTSFAISVAAAFTLIGGTAWADSISDVQARVDTAYSAGNIDLQTRNDLKGTLDAARSATNASEYDSAIEAYKLLAPDGLAANFNSYGK